MLYELLEASVGAVVPRKKGGLVVAADHHFSFLDEDSGELQRIKKVNEEFPESRFNDGKCDPAGRFWAGKPLFAVYFLSLNNLLRI